MPRFLSLLVLTVLLTACLDPTVPEFQLEDPFYLVEGQILAGQDQSRIRIQVSNFREENKVFDPILGATVISREEGGAEFTWREEDPSIELAPGTYYPPAGFAAAPGETWWFDIVLPDGTVVTSDPEAIPEPVPLTSVDVRYEQNSTFDEGLNRFIPRFEVFLEYTDPADGENFYAYDYRFFEEVIVCFQCFRGIYRPEAGGCIEQPNVFRYDYLCDTEDCFKVTSGNQIVYRNDELTNGNSLTDIEIGGINFDAFGGLLVEGILLSITEEAFEYGKVIEDLTTGNAGLNATIPAALNGNVRNVDPAGQTVLGFLGAASTSRLRTYLERTVETGTPIPFDPVLRLEPSNPPFVPPRAPCEVDGRFAEVPEGWGG